MSASADFTGSITSYCKIGAATGTAAAYVDHTVDQVQIGEFMTNSIGLNTLHVYRVTAVSSSGERISVDAKSLALQPKTLELARSHFNGKPELDLREHRQDIALTLKSRDLQSGVYRFEISAGCRSS